MSSERSCGSFELPDVPPDQDSGHSDLSDSNDSYQSVCEYLERLLCVGRRIRNTSSKATERPVVAFRTASAQMKVLGFRHMIVWSVVLAGREVFSR